MPDKTEFALIREEMANLVSQLEGKDEIIQRQAEEIGQLRIQYEDVLVQMMAANTAMKKYDNPHVGSSANTYSRVKRQKAEEKRMDGESRNPNKSCGGSKFGHTGFPLTAKNPRKQSCIRGKNALVRQHARKKDPHCHKGNPAQN